MNDAGDFDWILKALKEGEPLVPIEGDSQVVVGTVALLCRTDVAVAAGWILHDGVVEAGSLGLEVEPGVQEQPPWQLACF